MKAISAWKKSFFILLFFFGLFQPAKAQSLPVANLPVFSLVQEPVHGRFYTLTVTAGMHDLDYLRIHWHDRTPDYYLNGILPAGESLVISHEFPRSLRVIPIKVEFHDITGTVSSKQLYPNFEPINELPTANDDLAATPENTPVIIQVLTNDQDADGDLLTVLSLRQPGHGSAVNNGGNTVTYQPDPNFVGEDAFTYTLWDGYQTVQGTVTVTVFSREPAVNITAARESIMLGDSTTLSWNTAWAENVQIDQGIGPVAASGTISVTPGGDTTYTITAEGTGGTISARVSVLVVTPVFRGAVISAEDEKYRESWFGASAAISGDYAVVGAPLADLNGKEDCGAAYIFKREGSGWRRQAKLSAGTGLPWDYFGSSVAISGDTVIVGASYAEVDGLYTAGAAYIFKRQNESWVEQARLSSTNPAAGEYFGHSVAISGNHAMVGVDTSNDNLYNPKVYIYHFDGTTWIPRAQLSPSDPESYWHFGNSVSINGDYAAVGAPYNFISGDQGSVYLYEYDGFAWQEKNILTASDAGSHDHFGTSVSISGDYLIAGAINHDLAEPDGEEGEGGTLMVDDAGAAYIFKRGPDGWFEESKLVAGDAADRLKFGLSVAVNGEYALVGADHNFNNGANNLSANYLFKRFGTRWVEQKIFNIGYATAFDEFGPYLGLSDHHFIVGNYWTGNLLNTGAAYIYGLPRVTADLTAEPPIHPNGESVLNWHADNAASCSIEPGIGPVPVNGSLQVKVTETTSYSLTAVGPLGSAIAQTTVTVGYPPPEITAAASSETIPPVTPVTLTWNTTAYTDSVMIDNGMGSMPPNGSIEITPAATTTFTLTASGPGGAASQAVTVTVLPPQVNLTATPSTISRGEEAVLTWNSSAADTVSMDNNIGPVPGNGSIIVTPDTTTTYNITATGPSGNGTASVTIQVTPTPPVVTLAAEPAALLWGQQTTLTWDTNDAASVRFGYGQTEFDIIPSGFLTLTPTATTTYRIKAANQAGTSYATATVKVLDPSSLGVAITSPKEGEILTVPQVQVQGIVTTGTDEVGVTVNGIPAQVNGGKFFANNIPLVEGENTVTVAATEPGGGTASDRVTILVDTSPPADWIKLNLNPDNGIAPLHANLRATWHLSFSPENTYIRVSDPENVEITPLSPTEADLSFTGPGFYTIAYIAADSHGTESRQEIRVNVLARGDLDMLLKARWNGMKDKLALQDIEGGLGYFLEESKGNYRGAFEALAGQLPQIAADMQEIELIYARDDRTKFRINRQHDINGTPVTITYYLYFVKDGNGLWKIEQF